MALNRLGHWARLLLAVLSLVGVLALRAGVWVEQAPAARAVRGTGRAADQKAGVLRLDRFFHSLSQLEGGSSTEPVRILWLGDVQVAEGTLPQIVREQLRARFGDGGVGFLSLAGSANHWSDVYIERQGRFQTVPALRDAGAVQSPGAWGLSGVGQRPDSDDAGLVVSVDSERATWVFEWLFRAGEAPWAFEVDSANNAGPVQVTRDNSLQLADGSYSFAQTFEGIDRVRAHRFVGAPAILGVVAERRPPGVVMDWVGIRGGRVGTALGWDRMAWSKAVGRRNPRLVVVALGRDEVHQGASAAQSADDLRRLLERLHQASPEADCLMIGPTFSLMPPSRKAPDPTVEHGEFARVAQLEGCEYFFPWTAIREVGAEASWSSFEPSFASSDGYRLSSSGYEVVGSQLGQRLLQSYDQWQRTGAVDGVRVE